MLLVSKKTAQNPFKVEEKRFMFHKFSFLKFAYFNLQFPLLLICLIFGFNSLSPAQKLAPGAERSRGKEILQILKNDIKTYYYNSDLNGVNLDEHFKKGSEEVERAVSFSHIQGIISQTLIEFDRSIIFYPPPSTIDVDFGVFLRMIGDRCYVVAVKPSSDAEAKGAKPGVEIVSINEKRPTRQNFDIMMRYYDVITSNNNMVVVAKLPDEKEVRPFDIKGRVIKSKRVLTIEDLINNVSRLDFYIKYKPYRFKQVNNTAILNLSGFYLSPNEIGNVFKNHINGSSNLILDLRGNVGIGYSAFEKPDKIEKLAGFFFENAVKIGVLKGRKEEKIIQSKPQGKDVFKGKLVVLIDSETSPEGQIFSRLIQIEKRGTVIGDLSKGGVFQSRYIGHSELDSFVFYGIRIPTAKVIMSDGSVLEQNGVMPDEQLLPSIVDLSSGLDPVLARALEIVGEKVAPAEAGEFFPVEWRKY
jgi:C-terminal processing protease CtpA/Prc